jgi:hypothetical protein|tara:strand:+ start:1131 stop:1388 length:258 start_codon:yes stop_codon:yes gene_type:complete
MNTPEGWEGLIQAEREAPRADDLDMIYGKVFKSAEGQKVLSHLRSITIEQPTWFPGEDASFGYARTGMAEIIRMIEKKIERSNNG